MPTAPRLVAPCLLTAALVGCASLIPDQSRDDLGLSRVTLSGALTPTTAQALGAREAVASTWIGTLEYQGSFADLGDLPREPTTLTFTLGFVSGTLSSACEASSNIRLTVSEWSVRLSDPATPGGVRSTSDQPLSYTVSSAGTALSLSASGPGVGQLSTAFAAFKPILTSGGQNQVTARARVELRGCPLSASLPTLSLSTPELQQTLSFK